MKHACGIECKTCRRYQIELRIILSRYFILNRYWRGNIICNCGVCKKCKHREFVANVRKNKKLEESKRNYDTCVKSVKFDCFKSYDNYDRGEIERAATRD